MKFFLNHECSCQISCIVLTSTYFLWFLITQDCYNTSNYLVFNSSLLEESVSRVTIIL